MAETPRLPWRIEAIAPVHDRAALDCGQPVLNDWLRLYAGQYERRGLSRTYVGLRPGEIRVLGYYAISTGRVDYGALPAEQAEGLPRISVPVGLLGRLAVDRSVQGQGLGRHLLFNAFRRIEQISRQIGVRAIEVHAIDEDARSFYLRHGFVSLHDDPHHLYLPMLVVRKLGLPPLGPG